MRPYLPLWIAACVLAGGWAVIADSRYTTINCTALDGDTLACGDTRYRIHGLAAPERYEPGGPEATAALAAIIADGVSCEPTGHRTHDREEAVCTTSEGDVAALMVAAGRGRDCPRYSGGAYQRYETDASRTLPLPSYCRP